MVDEASAALASRRVNNEEKLKALRHVADCSLNKEVASAAGSRKLSAIMQRAAINPPTEEPAKALEMRFFRLSLAPPYLSIEDPHKWWNLIATAGLSGRAPEEAWN